MKIVRSPRGMGCVLAISDLSRGGARAAASFAKATTTTPVSPSGAGAAPPTSRRARGAEAWVHDNGRLLLVQVRRQTARRGCSKDQGTSQVAKPDQRNGERLEDIQDEEGMTATPLRRLVDRR